MHYGEGSSASPHPQPTSELPGSVFSYSHLSFEVPIKNGGTKRLVDDVSVTIRAGELLAIMGPSGAGKSTLIELMAFRRPMCKGGSATLNGHPVSAKDMYDISAFVEQEDALLGVLTVRETITYALRLHLPRLARRDVHHRVNRVLSALGLNSCADQIIGNAIQRGISGGQKRRVTAACAMVTFPRILLLDEVTSGLDSTAAREVMISIRNLAVSEGMIVIATIHQPSLETMAQFTDLLMLSHGKVCFSGKVSALEPFFERWGKAVPRFSTPVDHAMNFLNSDFGASDVTPDQFRAQYLSALASDIPGLGVASVFVGDEKRSFDSYKAPAVREGEAGPLETLFRNTLVLSHRTATNYSRNLLAYGVRAGMYAGMGLMLATIWIRLGDSDSTINDRLSVYFYSVAFLSFMSVAGIPSFLEERAVFYRESKNGLYGALPFVLSNTIVNLPFLFVCALLFTLICYWAIGLHAGGDAFFRFLLFLFLATLAAESQVQIVSALLPIFVASLAISSFLNGFWMSVGGYFIKSRSLPRFWYYSFHYMDYQRYAFELLTNSDLRGLDFKCVDSCTCVYPSSTPDSCTVSGEDVLRYLDIYDISYGSWIGVLISIIAIYRIGLYAALRIRSN